MKSIQELVTTGAGTEGSLLIQKTIASNIVEAVEHKRIGRQLAAMYFGPGDIQGSSIDVDTEDETSQLKVQLIAEGAPVPLSAVSFSSSNLKPKKYGARILVTREMLEDGKWNLLDYNVAKTGREIADNEDTLIIAALDQANETVSGGAAITIANITAAMQNLEENKYTPTDLLVGVEVANDLRNIDTFVEADKSGSTTALTAGLIGTVFGMRVFMATTITATSAYVLDRNHAFMVAEKRPPTLKTYSEDVYDIEGATVTQRITVSVLRSKAISKITTS